MIALRAFRKAAVMGALGLLASAIAACASSDTTTGSSDDLTSNTAIARTLTFGGRVFVAPGSSDAAILDTVRRQTQSAFGPIRSANMAVNSRELKGVDPSTFVKRDVKVVDTSNGNTVDMTEITYTYTDDAVVDRSYASRSTVPLALMNANYRAQTDRILRECTPNDEHSREFASSIWYVFEPDLPQCQKAIAAEQTVVDADRQKVSDPEHQVAKSEVDRLYVPITAQLGADRTNRAESYPEYHRLYRGGVQSDKLVVSLVFGLIDDKNFTTPSKDFNWNELMTTLDLVMQAQGEFRQVEGPDPVTLAHFELSTGKVVDDPSFSDLVNVRRRAAKLGLSSQEAAELQAQFASRIQKKWIAVEKPIRVAVGDEAPRDFAIRIQIYFGAGTSSTPHKFATKNSDVFIYNGHSSIGYGPLDPRNFTAADFPKSYQLLWIDGCVSYNYYEKDYIPLKEGGTKNLDLVTNGIEAPAWRGGSANGKFLAKLLSGTNASYRDLLSAAQETEALRVVDGELDNEFTPSSAETKVVLSNP